VALRFVGQMKIQMNINVKLKGLPAVLIQHARSLASFG
jgi:hypothetical protein